MSIKLLPTYASDLERTIARRLITKLLAAGCAITISNGGAPGDEEIEDSTDKEAILQAMSQTGLDYVRSAIDGQNVSTIMLVYGNDEDLVSDFTDNEFTNAIIEAIQ